MEWPAALVTALNDVNDEFASALPNAPVVPVKCPRRTRTVRVALAKSLTRAARVIAQPDPPAC